MNSISFKSPFSEQTTAALVAGGALIAYSALEREVRNIADAVLTTFADIVGSPTVACGITAFQAAEHLVEHPNALKDLPDAKKALALVGGCGVFSAVRHFLQDIQRQLKEAL